MPPSNNEHTRWFAEEVQPHEPSLRAYLRNRFPTLHDIDDLIQETYARLLRSRHNGRMGQNRAYLFVTARNTALDLFRRQNVLSFQALAEIEKLPLSGDEQDAAEAASRHQEIQILREAIDALPARCRDILILRRYDNLSHKQIAERLQISENTVNAQLVIGMLRCRQYLLKRGIPLSPGHADQNAS